MSGNEIVIPEVNARFSHRNPGVVISSYIRPFARIAASGTRPAKPSLMTTVSHAPSALIADDQQDVLEALRLLLKNEGFTTETVTSPKGVLDAIQARDFDLLLLDLNYARDTTSGREGLDLLAQIQAIDNTVPVVLMTAWGSVELAVEAMQHGGSDFIQKPWDNERLLSILRKQIEAGKVIREKKRESTSLTREMEDAREIQQRLLPKEMPKVAGCDIRAAWQPLNAVGGDYFDVIQLSETSVAVCVADVMGKGLPAALLMSNIQGTVRAFARDTQSPAEMCKRINRSLCDNIGSHKFATFFYGVIDTAQNRLTYANAGHIPPIVMRSDGSHEQLTEGGLVLGIVENATYKEACVDVTEGDRVVLVTDGITEATDSNGEEFGMDRLVTLLEKWIGKPDLHREILSSVSEFANQEFQDDATILVATLGQH